MPFFVNTDSWDVFSVSISGALITAPGSRGMHACMPSHPMPLGIMVYSNALLHVSLFVVDRFEAIFTLHTGRMFTHATEGLWKTRALGGRDAGVPPFKKPTLNKGMLWAAEIMRDGYHPKMLLYTLDELFFIYVQIRDSP